MKHTKSLATVALISGMALGLSACGGAAQPAAPTSPNVPAITPAAAPTSAAPQAEKSERGNLVKKVGQAAGEFNPENNKPTVNFTIKSIKADPVCTGPYPQKPENGHFVVIDVAAATTAELGKLKYSTHFDVSPASFKFIGANGTTFNGNLGSAASFGCLPGTEMFPQAGMGPAENVTGKVVLDLPATTGILVFKDLFGGYDSGWEYKF